MEAQTALPPVRREPDREQATEPVDYGVLNAVYAGLLAAVVVASRERARRDPISGTELIEIGAATFTLSKVVAREKIGTWVREPFVEDAEKPEGRRPRGRRLRHAVGELVTCTRCLGAWSALAVVSLRTASPDSGRLVTNVLAAAAANDFLHAGFRALCQAANALDEPAPSAPQRR